MKPRSRMMQECMSHMKSDKFKDMFSEMAGSNDPNDEVFQYVPAELRALFEDWLGLLEDEIIAFARDKESISPENVAQEFKISKESANFVLQKLSKEKRVNVEGLSEEEEK